MLKINEYDLPDARLAENCEPGAALLVWEPEFFCVVLGQGSKIEHSLYLEKIEQDRIPVYKRPSGGETVILSPNTLVISFVKKNEPLRSPKRYFTKYNELIISALSGLGVKNLSRRGISDICIGSKKILGSSIYRSKAALLYHAVLNISEPVSRIEHYLKHPVREPDYRGKRAHRDFVTSLSNEGYPLAPEHVKSAIQNAFL